MTTFFKLTRPVTSTLLQLLTPNSKIASSEQSPFIANSLGEFHLSHQQQKQHPTTSSDYDDDDEEEDDDDDDDINNDLETEINRSKTDLKKRRKKQVTFSPMIDSQKRKKNRSRRIPPKKSSIGGRRRRRRFEEKPVLDNNNNDDDDGSLSLGPLIEDLNQSQELVKQLSKANTKAKREMDDLDREIQKARNSMRDLQESTEFASPKKKNKSYRKRRSGYF